MNYKALKSSASGEFKDRGSKFLSFAEPVSTVEEVKEKLSLLRKKYHDARHHCFAYMIGMEKQEYRSNDDGEPNHSAGDPILSQIRSFGLTNTMVVVIRYFGGTKLGVSGLINAYRLAAREALKKAPVKVIFPAVKMMFEFEYLQTSGVDQLLKLHEAETLSRDFAERCRIVVSIRATDQENFLKGLTKMGIQCHTS